MHEPMCDERHVRRGTQPEAHTRTEKEAVARLTGRADLQQACLISNPSPIARALVVEVCHEAGSRSRDLEQRDVHLPVPGSLRSEKKAMSVRRMGLPVGRRGKGGPAP